MTYTDYDANTDTFDTHDIGPRVVDGYRVDECIILESVSDMFSDLMFCKQQAD